jgi:predicted deacetylase
MEFCIRDDDTSFFTTPDELERSYGEIMKLGPVSLAIIPFCRAGTSKGVPPQWRQHWSIHALHENGPLVDYLRQRISEGRLEPMLHGYHHDEPDGVYEFERGQNLVAKVAEGRQYLEQLLGTTIRVFVPPHNTIGRQGLQALAKAGLHLAGTGGLRSGWALSSPYTWATWLKLRVTTACLGGDTPHVLNLGDHREIPGVAMTPRSSLTKNQELFERALANRGAFCAAAHYWEFETPSVHPDHCNVGEHLWHFVHRVVSDSRVTWRSVGDVVSQSMVSG